MDFYVSPVTLLFESSLISIAPKQVQMQTHIHKKGNEHRKEERKEERKDEKSKKLKKD